MPVSVTIGPLDKAVEKFGAKSPIGSTLSSKGWANVPVELREAALFTARIEDARFLADLQKKLRAAIGLQREAVKNGEAFVDRSSFIGDMRQLAAPLSTSPNPFADRGITNIASPARLGLIWDMQVTRANSYARDKMSLDADVMDAFPAWELLRLQERKEKRDWRARWEAAGGKLYSGRMVALKTDPIWTAISDFGTSTEPFAWGSGMGKEEVSRDDAIAIGLIEPDARIEAEELPPLSAGLEASVEGLPEAFVKALNTIFGKQIAIEGNKARWVGGAS
jgi:hypothetical protein